MKLVYAIAAVCLSLSDATVAHGQASAPSGVSLRKAPATKSIAPESTAILGAARAGNRLVGVGARGMVLLSDDTGKTWRQATAVPVRSTLTSVHFVDDRQGWAVGHNGAILVSTDGGDHWTLQRFDAAVDRPLFSVHFLDRQRGIAVGLWSLILATSDSGATWNEVKVPTPPEGGKADRNLFEAFASPSGVLYVAAERGAVLRSKDAGVSWEYMATGYKGSLWTGVAVDDRKLVVAGMRGTVYRSDDAGGTWVAVPTGSQSSLTTLRVLGHELVAVGLDGVTVRSADGMLTVKVTQREDRLALTSAVAATDGSLHLFSTKGIVHP